MYMFEAEGDLRIVESLKKGIYKMLGEELIKEEIELDYLMFEHNRIEGNNIPYDVLEVLADPISTTGIGYRDKNNGDYYQVCHLYYVGPEPYELWLKNGEVIDNPYEH